MKLYAVKAGRNIVLTRCTHTASSARKDLAVKLQIPKADITIQPLDITPMNKAGLLVTMNRLLKEAADADPA